MDILELLKIGTEKRASDIHIAVDAPPILRVDGKLIPLKMKPLNPKETKELVYKTLPSTLIDELERKGEVDASLSYKGVGRLRVNAYKQCRFYAMALRLIPFEIPNFESLGLPTVVKELTKLSRGLILVTGPSGSGKSTTLAAMIDLINNERCCHIITLEDPIEYIHMHKKSIVHQREIGTDTHSFASGLRAALRQDPDVILVGEMRDLETISTALTAAETGHLVLSSLHTLGSANTIERIIDIFPPFQQHQVRIQLSNVLQAIISQQLLPKSNGEGRIAAVEVMITTPAIRNLIREEKVHQIDTAIQTGAKYKMQTMENSILELYRKGLITKETVLMQSVSKEHLMQILKGDI